MKKILVREELDSFSVYEFDGLSMSDLRKWADESEKGYPSYFRVYLDVDANYYDDPPRFVLYGEREESDKEFEERKEKERKEREKKKAARAKAKEAEYQEYLKLKEKYES